MICEVKINGEDSRLYQEISDRLPQNDAMLEYSRVKSIQSLYRENEQGEPRYDDVTRGWLGNDEMEGILRNFLKDVGVKIRAVDAIKDESGDKVPATAKADITRRTIEYIQGKESSLLEESSHFIVESLDKDSTLYKSIYDMIDRYDEYKDVKKIYNMSEDRTRRETMAKVLANKIANRFEGNVIKQRQVDSWLRRIIDQLKKIFTFDTERFNELDVAFNEVIDKVVNRELDTVQGDGVFYQLNPVDRLFTDDIEEINEDSFLQTDPKSSGYFVKIPGGYEVTDVNNNKWTIQDTEEDIASAKLRLLEAMKQSKKEYKTRLISDLSSKEPQYISTHMHRILREGLDKEKGKYQDYSEVTELDYLKSENIVLHKDEVDGTVRYTILIGSYKYNRETTDVLKLGDLTTKQAKRLGVTVLDNLEGRSQMLGALVAMELLSKNPESRINGVRFSSGGKRGYAKHVNLHEAIANWKLIKESGYDDILPTSIDDELLDYTKYYTDYIGMVFKYYKDNSDYDSPFKKEDPNHIKLENINKRINRLYKLFKDVGLKNEGIKKEFEILTEAKKHLEELERGYGSQPNTNDLNALEEWMKNQLEQPNEFVNYLMGTIRKWFYSIKENYKIYNKEKNRAFEKYMKAWSEDSSNNTGVAKTKEILFSNQEDIYKDLFIYEELEMYDEAGKPIKENGKVKTKLVNTFRFKEDAQLKSYQKEFVKYVMTKQKESIIDLAKKKIEEGLFDDDYDSAEKWYEEVIGYNDRLLNLLGTDLNSALLRGEIKKGVQNWYQQHMDFQDLDFAKDPREFTKNDLGTVNNVIGDKYGNKSRRARLGITYIGHKPVYTGGATLSMDVQLMLDTFIYGNMKQKRMGEFRSAYLTAKLALQREGLLKNKEMKRELSTVEKLYNFLVYREMEKIDVHLFDKKVDASKFMNNMRKVTSGVILTGNFASGLITLIGSNTSLITNTAANMYGKAFFQLKNLYNAAKYIGSNFDKANQITELMGLHNSNESTLMYGDRFKAGKSEIYKGLLNGRFNMVFAGMGDYIAKMLITIGQLDRDGILHNFKLDKQGDVYYDWSIDKRDKLITDKIQENLENMQMPKGEKGFLLPYDNNMLDSLQTISSQILGSMNDEQRGRLNTSAWASLLFHFKSYLISRANQLWSRGYVNQNIRTYSVKNGKLQLDMLYQEGFLNSLATVKDVIVQNRGNLVTSWSQFNDAQRSNLRRFGISLVTYAAAYLAYTAGDDEDKNPYKKYLGYALTDLIGVYHPSEYLKGFSSPPTIDMTLRLIDTLGSAMVFDFEESGSKFINLFGLTRNIKYAYETFQ